jgi:hypothetical protein
MSAKIVPMQSLNALISQTKAAWGRADEKKHDADEWYIRTGKLLIELKKRAGHGQWLSMLKQLGRSPRRAQELMELVADKTVEEQRDRKRKVARKKAKANARYSAHSEEEEEEEEDNDPGFQKKPPEEVWQEALAHFCGELIAAEAHWNKEFPGWQDYDCPSHIQTLLMQAATALARINALVAKHGRKTG